MYELLELLILLYGDTGDGKSTAAANLIRRLPKGARARLYTVDNWEAYRPYVTAGLLDVWQLSRVEHPFEALEFACKGFWPDNPKSANPKYTQPTAKTFEEIRLWIFEGLTTFSDIMMGALADRVGAGVRVGPGTRPGEDAISFKDGSVGIGGNTQSHYGLAQRQLRARVEDLGLLPGIKLVTAHQIKAVEENKLMLGPQAAGNKLTPVIPRWFDHVLHATTVPVKGGMEYRIYLREHMDPGLPGVPCKAVTRLPANMVGSYQIPEYLVADCDVLGRYLDILLDIQARSLDSPITR